MAGTLVSAVFGCRPLGYPKRVGGFVPAGVGGGPLAGGGVSSAAGNLWGGWPVSGGFKNQGVAVGSVLKKARSWWATLGTPPVALGWVKSLCKSSGHSQVKPSPRGVIPSAQRYGPQDSQGATAGPWLVS